MLSEPGTSIRRYLSAALVFYLLVVAVVMLALQSSHLDASRRATEHANGLRRLFSSHVERIFTSIYWLGEAAGDAYHRNQGNPAALQTELAEINKREPLSLQLAVVNKSGIFVASDVSSRSNLDLRDREHISTMLSPDAPRLFVSKPLVGRVSGKKSINITSRITDDAGQLTGITVVSFDPSAFRSVYSSLEVGVGGVISLFRSDGTLLARSSGPDDAIGSDLSSAPVFHDFILPGKREGVSSFRSVIDGMTRLYSFQVVESLPLVVAIGVSYDEIYFQHNRLRTLAAGFLAFLFVVLSAGALARIMH